MDVSARMILNTNNGYTLVLTILPRRKHKKYPLGKVYDTLAKMTNDSIHLFFALTILVNHFINQSQYLFLCTPFSIKFFRAIMIAFFTLPMMKNTQGNCFIKIGPFSYSSLVDMMYFSRTIQKAHFLTANTPQAN